MKTQHGAWKRAVLRAHSMQVSHLRFSQASRAGGWRAQSAARRTPIIGEEQNGAVRQGPVAPARGAEKPVSVWAWDCMHVHMWVNFVGCLPGPSAIEVRVEDCLSSCCPVVRHLCSASPAGARRIVAIGTALRIGRGRHHGGGGFRVVMRGMLARLGGEACPGGPSSSRAIHPYRARSKVSTSRRRRRATQVAAALAAGCRGWCEGRPPALHQHGGVRRLQLATTMQTACDSESRRRRDRSAPTPWPMCMACPLAG